MLPRRGRRRLGRGDSPPLLIITDATEPNTGSIMMGYATRHRASAGTATRTPGAGALQIVPQVRMRFNPTRESSNLFVPGLMAFVLTIISSLMTAISLTREKETGTMEVLLVSPLRPWEIIVGKVAPYLVLGFVSVLLVLVEARLVFHVPLRGSLVLLLLEGVLFILDVAVARHPDLRGVEQRVAMMGALVGTCCRRCCCPDSSFRSRACRGAAVALEHRAGQVVRDHRARHHAQGRRPRYLWRETLILVGMALVPAGQGRAVSRSGWARAVRTVLFLVAEGVLHIVRDRATVSQIFMMPVVQLLVLANAATFDVKRCRCWWWTTTGRRSRAAWSSGCQAGTQFRIVAVRADRRRTWTTRCSTGR